MERDIASDGVSLAATTEHNAVGLFAGFLVQYGVGNSRRGVSAGGTLVLEMTISGRGIIS